ncbi:MAG: hypothetical protein WBL45_09800, partial [Solirubrobacterales bacterium]
IEIALLKAGQQALQADSLADLEKAQTAEDEAVLRLRTLVRQIEESSSADKVRKRSLSPGLVTQELFDPSSPDATVAGAAFIEIAPPVPEVKAKISWVVLGAEEPGVEIHADDYVRFSIELEGEATFPQVEIDVGDSSPTKQNVPAPGTRIVVTHRYRRATGKPAVVVCSAPGGVVLGEIELPRIDPVPRPLEAQRRLDESDKVVERAAFLLAVGSGMVALYLADPSWGQPADYLAAFIWGGATGEGVKLAAAVAERIWPAT